MVATPVFGFFGHSGSGKTTLIGRLLPVLAGRGLRVSVLKHAHHGFDIDRPGKDSWQHREAGACEVMLASGQRWALLHECRDDDEPTLHELLPRFGPCDLIVLEGWKSGPGVRAEVHRRSQGKPLLALRSAAYHDRHGRRQGRERQAGWDETHHIVAVIGDPAPDDTMALTRCGIAVLAQDRIDQVADLVLSHARPLVRR